MRVWLIVAASPSGEYFLFPVLEYDLSLRWCDIEATWLTSTNTATLICHYCLVDVRCPCSNICGTDKIINQAITQSGVNNQRFRVHLFPTNPSKYASVGQSRIMWETWVYTKTQMSQCSRPWKAVGGCTVDVDSLHIPLLTSSGHVRNKQINRTKPGHRSVLVHT